MKTTERHLIYIKNKSYYIRITNYVKHPSGRLCSKKRLFGFQYTIQY